MGIYGSCGCSSILNDLYTTKGYSDLKILCNGFYFQTHRAVICTQSEPLKDLVQGTAGNYKIKLDGSQPLIVAKIVEFLYTYDYSDIEYGYGQEYGTENRTLHSANGYGNNAFANLNTPGSSSTSRSSVAESEDDIADAEHGEYSSNNPDTFSAKPGRWPLTIHTKVYKAARRYKIPALEALVVTKYSQLLEREVWDVNDLVTSLQLLYVGMEKYSTPLREKALLAASKGVERLVSYDVFTSLLKDNGDVGVDVLNSVLKANQHQPAGKGKPPNVMSWLFSWAGKRTTETKGETETGNFRKAFKEIPKFPATGTDKHPLADLYKKPTKTASNFAIEEARQRFKSRTGSGPSSWRDSVRLPETRAPETRAVEARAAEVRIQENKARAINVSELNNPEVRARQVKIPEPKAPEIKKPLPAVFPDSEDVKEEAPDLGATSPDAQAKSPKSRESQDWSRSVDGVKSPDRVKSPDSVKYPNRVKTPERMKSPEEPTSPERVKSPQRVHSPDEDKSTDKPKSPERVISPDGVKTSDRAKSAEIGLDWEKAPEDTLGVLTSLRTRDHKPPAYRTISMPHVQAIGFPWATLDASGHPIKSPEETPTMYGFPVSKQTAPKIHDIPSRPTDALLPARGRAFRSSEVTPTLYTLSKPKDTIPTISRAQLEDIRRASKLKAIDKRDGIGSNTSGSIPTAGGLF